MTSIPILNRLEKDVLKRKAEDSYEGIQYIVQTERGIHDSGAG